MDTVGAKVVMVNASVVGVTVRFPVAVTVGANVAIVNARVVGVQRTGVLTVGA